MTADEVLMLKTQIRRTNNSVSTVVAQQ